MSSMLAAVARAAGLDTKADYDTASKPGAVRNPAAVAALLADNAGRSAKRLTPASKAQAVPFEAPEALAYITALEARGHRIDTKERTAIMAYGVTWIRSPEVRREFSSFDVFAAYSRAKARNAFRVLGQ